MMTCWETLQLGPTSDKLAIKKAYVKLLKHTNPEDNAGAYQELREAYESALNEAEYLEESSLDETADTFPAEDINPDKAVYSPWLTTPDQDSASATSREITTGGDEQNETDDEKVRQLVHQLQETLEQKGVAAAIQYFNEIKQHKLLDALDNEYRFEGEMMLMLHMTDEAADELLIAAGDHFNWNSDNNPFTYDHHYNYAHYGVSHRLLEAKFRQAVKKEFCSVSESEWKRVFPTLLDLLNEDELEALYQSELRGLVSSILYFAGGHENHYYRQMVDAEIFNWWWDRASEDGASSELKNLPDPSTYTSGREQESGKNGWQDDKPEGGSSFYYWWLIFWIILIIIRVASQSSGS